MRKGRSIIGLKVISQPDGEVLGSVREIVFDRDNNYLVALVLSDWDLFGLIQSQVVPWEEIVTLGPDAIMVRSHRSKIQANARLDIKHFLERKINLIDMPVYTTDGQALGTLTDVCIDEHNGRVLGYKLSDTPIDAGEKHYLPARHGLRIGEDVALAPPAAVHDLNAGPLSMQDAFPLPVAPAAQPQTPRLQVAPVHTPPAAPRPNERHKPPIGGRIAQQPVYIPDPADPSQEKCLLQAGDIIMESHLAEAEAVGASDRLYAAVDMSSDSVAPKPVAPPSVPATDELLRAAIGKQAGAELKRPDGTRLIAPGMIITAQHVLEARQYGLERDLLSTAMAGMRSDHVEPPLRERTEKLWESLKKRIAGLAQDHAATPPLDMRIQHALGRPVSRVVLDPDDQIILNRGEIVTHAAVERARVSHALEFLLDSVYDGELPLDQDVPQLQRKGNVLLADSYPSRDVPPPSRQPDTPVQGQPM